MRSKQLANKERSILKKAGAVFTKTSSGDGWVIVRNDKTVFLGRAAEDAVENLTSAERNKEK
jgi:hypothetical protein